MLRDLLDEGVTQARQSLEARNAERGTDVREEGRDGEFTTARGRILIFVLA